MDENRAEMFTDDQGLGQQRWEGGNDSTGHTAHIPVSVIQHVLSLIS